MRRIRYLPAFLSAAACAALLYGLSVRFPNPLTQALSPVNASPWELGKLAFWPCLPAVLALRRLDGGSSLSGLCAAVLTATALAVRLGAAGLPPVPLCLLAVSHGLAAYALLLHRLRPSPAGLLRVLSSGESAKVRHILNGQTRVAVCQFEGPRWCTVEGVATIKDDPESVAEAVKRYAERYRQPRPNPRRVAIEITITKALGSASLGAPR